MKTSSKMKNTLRKRQYGPEVWEFRWREPENHGQTEFVDILWVIPRWGERTLASIRAGEVELWMRSLPLARSTCAKIRTVMSVLFNTRSVMASAA